MASATFLPESESKERLSRLQERVRAAGLDAVLVMDGMDPFYYVGTIQNGLLFVPAQGEPLFFVRRSVERSLAESPFSPILPYVSFKDVSAEIRKRGYPLGTLGISESTLTLSLSKMLAKAFEGAQFLDCSLLLKKVRSVKSLYELDKIRQAGEVSRSVTEKIPSLLREGMTEWELSFDLHRLVCELGKSCFTRLAPGTGEFFLGNVCFGSSSVAPTAFDGPGGIAGLSPAYPYGGSLRKLEQGDLVFIDIAYPYEEYAVDKTRLYSFRKQPSPVILEQHQKCLAVQEAVREGLRPGIIPSELYAKVMNQFFPSKNDQRHFMGFETNQVKFLGHGIGLNINEYPVIAPKFEEPLEENMVLAVEPKMGLSGLGMVGIENTFRVAPNGGELLTPGTDAIVVV